MKPVLATMFALPYIHFAKASVRFVDADKSDLVVLVKGQWFVQADTGWCHLLGARKDSTLCHMGKISRCPAPGTISKRARGRFFCHQAPCRAPAMGSFEPYRHRALALTSVGLKPQGCKQYPAISAAIPFAP